MKEKTFNKLFNAFILIGMTVSMVFVTALKLADPQADRLFIIIAAIGSLMGVLSSVCSANAKILTFVFGFIDVSIYAVMCYIGENYGNAALHVLYFVPMQFIGYYQWSKHRRNATLSDGHKESSLKARRLSVPKRWLFLGIFTAASIVSYIILLQFDKTAANSFIRIAIAADAVSVVCNVIGQLLMSTAYMEQWVFWIAVNIFSIVMWTSRLSEASGDTSFYVIYIIKYSFYLLNSLNGLRIWLRLSDPSSSACPESGSCN